MPKDDRSILNEQSSPIETVTEVTSSFYWLSCHFPFRCVVNAFGCFAPIFNQPKWNTKPTKVNICLCLSLSFLSLEKWNWIKFTFNDKFFSNVRACLSTIATAIKTWKNVNEFWILEIICIFDFSCGPFYHTVRTFVRGFERRSKSNELQRNLLNSMATCSHQA